MTNTRVRASKADVAWHCSMSVVDDGSTRISTAGEEAELGQAFHTWAQSIGEKQPLDYEYIAGVYGVDVDELGPLCQRALTMWDNGIGDLQSPDSCIEQECVVERHGVTFSATLDRMDWDGDAIVITDWKTGRNESGYDHQMKQQAFVAATWFNASHAKVRLAFVRSGAVIIKTFYRHELDAWAEMMAERVNRGVGVYHPDERWCWKCDKEATCEAAKLNARKAITRLSDDIVPLTHDNKDIVGPQIAEMLSKVKAAKRWCEEFEKRVKVEVDAVGECPAGDGNVLVVEERNREEWDAMVAVPLLIEAVGEEPTARCCKISKTAAKKAIHDRFPRGEKSKEWAAFCDSVDAAGGVDRSTTKVLTTRKMEVSDEH